ncbi:MAG: hypothetical protein ACOYL6_19140 [Bacteriovoracaceae bacterium]
MKTILTLMVLGLLTTVHAGDRVGNGGGAHFCPGQGTAELYDLFEGRTRYQMVLDSKIQEMNSQEQIDSYLISKLAHFNPYMSQKIASLLKSIDADKLVFLDNIDLKEITDANFLMTEKGCIYEQLANWDDGSGKIFVDKTLYKLLPLMDKVALRWHEAVYKFFRVTKGAENSDYTRKIIAGLFAQSLIQKVYDLDWTRTDVTKLFILQKNHSDNRLNFPYFEFNKKIVISLETFSPDDQAYLQQLENRLADKKTKRKERKALRSLIAQYKSMRDRNICLPLSATPGLTLCKGITENLNVSSSTGFQIFSSTTYGLVYLKIVDGAETIWVKVEPFENNDGEDIYYTYDTSIQFSFGAIAP